MIADLLYALLAAVIITALTLLLKRPRDWVMRTARRIGRALSPDRHEDMQRANERIAATLAYRANMEDGNPDDEYYEDLYRWFSGDPDANIDYSRKQQRDLERLNRGLNTR
jgi:hypothetical protein